MKKLLLPMFMFLLMGVASFAQTIVSTTPENKKAILEIYTGIQCVYCPDGQQIARTIKDNNPDNFFYYNIHQGGFSTPQAGQPDFRTPFGDPIVAQSQNGGAYPTGSASRTYFPALSYAGGTAMGRGNWTSAANQVMSQNSYVNVAAEAEIDVQTNELSVHVEAYYTDDSPEATNKLNVVLLQNNTTGPQVGGNMGNDYVHMHRLIHMVTGQWGVDINDTSDGSFVDETFTYIIPADLNGVPIEIADLELIVFVSETTQDIISGNGTFPTYTNFVNANDISIKDVASIMDQCMDEVAPTIDIQNLGSNTLTSLDIEYSVNGGTPETHTWTGNLTSMQTETVELPAISYDIQANNTIEISIADDQNNSNNEETISFDQAVESISTLTLTVNTDGWGSECTWNIKDSSGATVESGGPYANNQTYTIGLTLPEDCYQFNIIDSYGDGGGAVTLEDFYGTIVYSTSGNYGSGEATNFSTDGELSTNEQTIQNISLYPNPTTGIVQITTEQTLSIEVHDISGKLVYQQSNVTAQTTLNLSALNAGVYFVKMTGDNTERVQKLIKK